MGTAWELQAVCESALKVIHIVGTARATLKLLAVIIFELLLVLWPVDYVS